MPLGRQLAVYCLDVAVITGSSLVWLTSITVVAYRSDRDIAYLMGGLWTCHFLSTYRVVRHWTAPRLGKERQLHLHNGETLAVTRTYQVINRVDDQRGALDHKHTYIHVLSYGIVPAGWLLSPFFIKMGKSSNGSLILAPV